MYINIIEKRKKKKKMVRSLAERFFGIGSPSSSSSSSSSPSPSDTPYESGSESGEEVSVWSSSSSSSSFSSSSSTESDDDPSLYPPITKDEADAVVDCDSTDSDEDFGPFPNPLSPSDRPPKKVDTALASNVPPPPPPARPLPLREMYMYTVLRCRAVKSVNIIFHICLFIIFYFIGPELPH